MHYIKVAAAALNQTPLDWEHNKTNIITAIHKAKEMGVTLLCCPELCISGYGCEDMFLSSALCEIALEMLFEIAPYTQGMIVSVGLPLLSQEGLYNTACILVDGKIEGFIAKQHLANTGVYYESRWFKSWPSGVCTNIALRGQEFPLGDLIFDINGVRIGFEICEDAWVAIRKGIYLAKRGVDIILNPSASHFALGKSKIRNRLVTEGAKAFGVCYIYANLLGNEAGRLIYDGDTLIAIEEGILKEGPRFSFQDVVVTKAIVNIEALRVKRSPLTALEPENDPCIYKITRKLNHTEESVSLVDKSSQEKGMSKEEEFTRAVTLGLFDYLRKSRAKGFVLNLSGGADSSACVCLIYIMVQLAFKELNSEGVLKKLSYLFKNDQNFTVKNCLSKLLFCLYQNTKNNSDITKQISLELAKVLGFPIAELSIDKLVTDYCQLLQPAIGRNLTWNEDDIALQNIQARVRGPGAWMLANVREALFLCTSNRSEAAVGYMTIDGDTCGGVSPLGGINKSFILHWLKWLEEGGFQEIGPLTILKKVTALAPSAELSPKANTQTDEADLMPYALLDYIERLFVLEKKLPTEIFKILQNENPTEEPKTLANAVERFFKLWARNQWKRERIAPSFHVDEESVDPKTWCRFPILSSGFNYELEKMWQEI